MLKSFSDFTKLVQKQFEVNSMEFQDLFVSELGAKIAERTPVRTGLAKGNWGATDNINPQPVVNFDKSSSGNRAKAKIYKEAGAVSKAKAENRTVYLSNGVDSKDNPDPLFPDEEGGYIIKLENGASPKAPHGMVYVTLANTEAIKKKAKRRLK